MREQGVETKSLPIDRNNLYLQTKANDIPYGAVLHIKRSGVSRCIVLPRNPRHSQAALKQPPADQ